MNFFEDKNKFFILLKINIYKNHYNNFILNINYLIL